MASVKVIKKNTKYANQYPNEIVIITSSQQNKIGDYVAWMLYFKLVLITLKKKKVAPNVFIISICLGNLIMEACIKFTIPKTFESKNSMNNVYT